MRLTLTSEQWTLYAARALSLLWAGFWIWFGIASGISENPTPSYVFKHTVPGIVCLLPALVAWKWERPGGWFLFAFAFLIAGLYLYMFRQRLDRPFILPTTLILALPPLIAGLLYLAHASRIRRA